MGSLSVGLSIVIPLYNAMKYLSMCMDSILATEGIEDTQIIIVNDGSTDDSGMIADDYANRCSNITVYHKQNEGASEARNYGLNRAVGKYVFFCDADDKVVPEVLSEIIVRSSTETADVILWDADIIDSNGLRLGDKGKDYFIHKCKYDSNCQLSGKKFIEQQIVHQGDFATVIWLGAYRREFLTENSLFFMKGVVHEDDLWVPLTLLRANSVIAVNKTLYLYRIHSGSVSDSDVDKHISSLLIIYPILFEYCDKKLPDDGFRCLLKGNLTRKYLHWIFEYDFCGRGYGDKIDIYLLWKNSRRIRDRLRVLVVLLNTMRRQAR